MKFTFTPEHIVLNDLLGRDIRYIIPNYQRPYSWDCTGKSERNNQVNIMWDDLFTFFNGEEKGEYFFGSMVLIDKAEREFEVIDGQQRLTTLILLFVGVKCFLNGLGKENYPKEKKEEVKLFIGKAAEAVDDIIYNKSTLGLDIEKKVRIEKSAEFNYDQILEAALKCKEGFVDEKLTNEQRRIAKRYFVNRNYFTDKLKEEFLVSDIFDESCAKRLDAFTKFLQNRLSIVRIKTPNFECAYQIFEILNNRGLPLSNKDLFRNFIIKEFTELKNNDEDTFADLKPVDKWNNLDTNYTLTSDFIGRWVESRKGAQQKYSAFNDLKQHYETYHDEIRIKKIEKFYADIEVDLKSYSLIVSDGFTNSKIGNKIKFLNITGNLRYTQNLLIALFRNLNYAGGDDTNVLDFVTTYEKYVLNILLSPSKRFSNSPIYDAIQALNRGNYDAAKIYFELTSESVANLKDYISGQHKDNYIAKLLISKYIWYQETESDDVVDQTLNFDSATLEHIIPQTPDTNTNWTKNFNRPFLSEMTYKLGNMTLLTKRMNSAARNFDFSIKKQKYQRTLLPLTQELVNTDSIDSSFFESRQERIVDGIIKDLCL
ncbi:MAG: DUF262 domain-containing protein [Crocinitomix sp.]|nr:DUF262 domain-containing protein [Crocinitomix sp.]